MRYQQDLQVKLRDRHRKLMTVDAGLAAHQARLVAEWISSQPALRAILSEAQLAEPALNVDQWVAATTSRPRGFHWTSSTEEGQASLVWALLQRMAHDDKAGKGNEVIQYVHAVSSHTNHNDAWREMAEQVLSPLFDFLVERIGDESSVLYILERYVHRVEWFDRNALYTHFIADRANGEEVYNLDLQRFLFLEGNYITYAKVRSASGEADLIGGLDTDDPLVCEGKVFDGDNRGTGYLAKGVHQIISYARDHQKNSGYLVVFNISDRPLAFHSDGPTDSWPRHIEHDGIRIHLISIRALPPRTTASKLGKAEPIKVTREQLLTAEPD